MNELVLKGLEEIIEKYRGEDTDTIERNDSCGETIYIKEEVESYFKFIRLPYQLKLWRVYDSSGADCYCLAVSWFLKGKVELYTADLWLY